MREAGLAVLLLLVVFLCGTGQASLRRAAVSMVRIHVGQGGFTDGKAMVNSWQGEFPWQNLVVDGHEGISPVGSFPPNGFSSVQ